MPQLLIENGMLKRQTTRALVIAGARTASPPLHCITVCILYCHQCTIKYPLNE
jgi:hypothetical protein